MVDKGDIDIGLIGKPETEENTLPVREISLNLTTKFKLLVPKKSKLTFRDYVNLEEIQDYPFILYDRGFYHHQLKEFENAWTTQNRIQNYKSDCIDENSCRGTWDRYCLQLNGRK